MDICVDNVSKADPQLLEKANEDSAMAPLVGIMSDTGIPKTFFLPVGIPRPTMHTGDVKVGNAIMLSPIRKVRTPAALKIHCTTPKSARPYRLRDISIGKRHLTNRKRDASGERVRTLGSPTRSDTMSSSEDLLQTPSRVGKREKIHPKSVIFSKRRKISRKDGGSPGPTPVLNFEIFQDECDKLPDTTPDPWALDERSLDASVNMTKRQGNPRTPVRDVMAIITPPSRKMSICPYGLAPIRSSSDFSVSPTSFALSSENSPFMNGLVDRAVKDWFKDTDKDELFGLRIMAQPSPVPRVLEHPDSPGSPLPMSNQRRLVTPDDDEMLFRGDDSGLPTRQGAISTVRNFHPHLPIDSSYGSRATPPLVRFLKRPLAELSNATSSHGYLGNVPVQTAFKPGDDDNGLKPLSPYVSILRGSGTPKIRGASAGSIPSGESSEALKEQHAANNARAGSYSSQKVSRAPQVARKSVFREEFDIEYCKNLEKHPFDNLEDDNEMLF